MPRFLTNICWRTFFVDGVIGAAFLAGIYLAVSIAEVLL